MSCAKRKCILCSVFCDSYSVFLSFLFLTLSFTSCVLRFLLPVCSLVCVVQGGNVTPALCFISYVFISYIEFYILCFPLPRVLCVVRGGNVTPAPLTGGPGGRVTRRRVGCPPRHMRPPALPAHMHRVHQLHMHIALAHLMHHPCMRIKPFSDAPHQPYVLRQLSLQNHGCTIQPVNELSYF